MENLMKALHAIVVGTLPLLSSSVALAQNGSMMNGGGWMGGYAGMGAYGGILVPILIFVAVAGLVVWVVKQKGK
jgi:uncharacterized membrane protein